MRKLAIIFISAAALVLAFFLYLRLQANVPSGVDDARQSLDQMQMPATQPGSFLKPGNGTWVAQYDRNGRLTYQFKADYYDHLDSRTLKVRKPVVEFYLSNHQILQITGDEGTVMLSQQGERNIVHGSMGEPPRSGNLRHVTLRVFASRQQQDLGQADMVLTMQNVEFENDTYRLFTREYTDENGNVVPADQVPVKLNSRDYEFTGSGLVMFWNDMDKRLKSLEIAHGKQLIIYNADLFGQEKAAKGAPATPPTTAPAAKEPDPDQAQPAAQHLAPAEVVSTQEVLPQAQGERRPGRYRATFFKNVRILQSQQQLVQADTMDVDFLVRGDAGVNSLANPDTPPSALSRTVPAQSPPAPSLPSRTAGSPSVSPPAPSMPNLTPASTLTAQAGSTRPASAPVYVYWDGPVRVVPVDDPAAPPLQEKQAQIRLVGQPLLVHPPRQQQREQSDIQCADLTYQTHDGSAHLQGNADYPILLSRLRDGAVVSQIQGSDLTFIRDDRRADFVGPGTIESADPEDPKRRFHVVWEKSCTAHFEPAGRSEMKIRDAKLAGNVSVVEQGRFNLSADDALALSFENGVKSGSSTPQLTSAIATGHAFCQLHEGNQTPRDIRAERLVVSTAHDEHGKLYPQTIDATGDVDASEGATQDLACQHLRMILSPSRQSTGAHQNESRRDQAQRNQAQLKSLFAEGDVRFSGKNQQHGSGKLLRIEIVDQHPQVTLLGSQTADAEVSSADSRLRGPEIQFAPDDNTAAITGAGSLEGVQKPTKAGGHARPIHATWTRGAWIDGNHNRIDLQGDVHTSSEAAGDAPGSRRQDWAQADEILLTLRDQVRTDEQSSDSQTNNPQSKHSATHSGAGSDLLGGGSFLKNKQIASVSLIDTTATVETLRPTAEVGSKLLDANGALLQYNRMFGARIDYDMTTQRVHVPGRGHMISEDHAQAGKSQRSDSGAEAKETGGHGITAIAWRDGFEFDRSSHAAIFKGAVVVSHATESSRPQIVKLLADEVRAEFDPAPQAASGDESSLSHLALRSAIATGAPVTVIGSDRTLYTGEAQFDPGTQLLTCRAGALAAISVVDALGNRISCSSVKMDLRNNRLIDMENVNVHGRQ